VSGILYEVEQMLVTNAANLSLFMVSLSQVLLERYHSNDPSMSVLDLKTHFRGFRYVVETIKMLPQKPDEDLLAAIFLQVTCLGRIHPAQPGVSTT
jgi:hypothetical protein